jgi:O-acetyl-ADP-ribose deacetylase (regulator of RNase III)
MRLLRRPARWFDRRLQKAARRLDGLLQPIKAWVSRSHLLRTGAREALADAKKADLENPHHYRTPVQVCPRGCGYDELARREVSVHTGVWGRAEVTAHFVFETESCPHCGAPLVRECARCEEDIFAPVMDLCRVCGLPQPWATERRAGTDRAIKRLWRPEEEKQEEEAKDSEESPASRANDPALLLFEWVKQGKKKGKKKKKEGDGELKRRGDIWVIDGDLVQLDVAAVVSNDDVDGQMWAQVARAIKKAAGEGVERLAQEGKPFKPGQAWVTTAGNIEHLRGIIHVASMNRRGVTSEETVREALQGALRVAVAKGYPSIALAPFGIATIGRDAWYEMFAKTAVTFLSDSAHFEERKGPLSIVLVLFEPPRFEKEVEDLRRLTHQAWANLGEPEAGRPTWEPGRAEAETVPT